MSLYFSIIIPTYNRESFIKKTIESVLSQSYQNFELIIVDDGSTDNTEDSIKKIKSHKLFYYKKENAERGAARNFGIQKSRGDYVTFLDSDDLLFQNHLSVAEQHINRIHQPEVFFLNNVTTDLSGKVIRKKKTISGNLNKQLFHGNIFGSMGVFIRRDIAELNPFREDRQLAGTEDWELWLRLSGRYKLHYSNEATSSFVNHYDRSVLTANEDQLKKRTELLIHYLSEDSIFIKKYSSRINTIKAHMLSYTALHLAMGHKSVQGIKYLYKAFMTNPSEIFKARTLAICKYCLINLLNLQK